MSWKLGIYVLPPLFALAVMTPSLWTGMLIDDMKNSSQSVGFSKLALMNDLRHGSKTGRHYRPMEPMSYRVDNALWKRVAKALGGQGFGPGRAAPGEAIGPYPWKYASWGYHFSNLLIHAICASLVTWIAFQVSASAHVAVLAGILFALHPAAAAAIGWISGRTSALVCLFLLATSAFFLCFRYTRHPVWIPLILVGYTLALLSKEQAYMFPVVLLPWLRPLNAIPPRRTERYTAWAVAGLALATAGAALVAGQHFAAGFLVVFCLMLAGCWAIATSRGLALVFTSLLAVQLVVIFAGLLPSGVLEKEIYIESPVGFSAQRLAFDIYTILGTLGATQFEVRDALLILASHNTTLLVVAWVLAVLIMASPLVSARWRPFVLPWWLWFGMALAPLRGLVPQFFALANIYVATPAVALGAAIILRTVGLRTPIFGVVLGVISVGWLGSNLVANQVHLNRMGSFNYELHSLLEGSEINERTILRVVVNNPDPLGISYMVHGTTFLIFRIVQSAVDVGDWTAANERLVRERLVQVVANDVHGDCHFQAKALDTDRIRIAATDSGLEEICLARLRWADFEPEGPVTSGSVVVRRKPEFGNFPLTRAELYAFDPVLRRLVSAGWVDHHE